MRSKSGHVTWNLRNDQSTLLLPSAIYTYASVLINEVGKANNQSLLWGPYKPNLYFGVRPRIPKSLTAGLMWAKLDNYATAQASTLPVLFFRVAP